VPQGQQVVDGIPSYIDFLIGCVIGLLVGAPVRRWVLALRREILERRRHADAQREGSLKLLVMFATLHPAPWLVGVGVPYVLYRLWSDPLWPMWLWLIAGALAAPAVWLLIERRRSGRSPAPVLSSQRRADGGATAPDESSS
jgi:hypothetical protein